MEGSSHDLGNLSRPIVVGGVSDIEDLVMHRVEWCFQSSDDRSSNIQTVDYRSPRGPITRHANLLSRPSQSGEIIQNNVEAHSRGSAISGRIAHERRRKLSIGQLP